MTDTATWLDKLGLGKYREAFDAAEIDLAALPHLTDDDLKALRLPLGPRRKILAAAATELTGNRPAAAASAGSSLGAAAEAERRQLTVLFCDLVGSTALSTRLDPEDLREIIRSYQEAASGAIARYDGFVAKFMGDGILAYFGYPRAHEDAAERAVRAGLEIVATISTLEALPGEPLEVRLGIATGLVVVGDLIGRGSAPVSDSAPPSENPGASASGAA